MKKAAAPPYEIISREALQPAPALDWAYVCARHLLGARTDTAISQILEYVGRAANADRAWIFEYTGGLTRIRNTHEWCRADVPSYVEDLQDAPTTMIAWLHRYLAAGNIVRINDTAALPREARTLQAELLRQSDRSVLSIPVFHESKLRACIGLDATRSSLRWSDVQVAGLAQCAELIALARYGRDTGNSRQELEEKSASLIYLRQRGGVRGVPPETIVGVRSASNYSEVWLSDRSMVFDMRSFGMWVGLLSGSTFSRIHRTAIVNLVHLEEVDRRNPGRWEVRLRHIQSNWPVSRSYRAELRSRLGI